MAAFDQDRGMQPREDLPAGWEAVAYDEIDSTNSEAMRRAAAGVRGPQWITARLQTQGRGRSGRAWASAGQSLAATLMFSPACPLTALPGLSLVAGVAAHDAIARMLPEADQGLVRIKWPNDILIGRAKVSGILVESSVVGGAVVAVIGTGINIGAAPAVQGRQTSALALDGARDGFTEASYRLAHALSVWIGTWNGGRGFGAIREAWLSRAGALGEPMSVNAGGEQVSGRFAGLDEDGALILDTGAGLPRKFTFGDVALVAPSV